MPSLTTKTLMVGKKIGIIGIVKIEIRETASLKARGIKIKIRISIRIRGLGITLALTVRPRLPIVLNPITLPYNRPSTQPIYSIL